MKIVIFIISFLPERFGGAEICADNIAKKLSRKGHEVHVVTTTLKKESLEYDKYHIHRLKTLNIPIIRSLIYSFKSLFLIKKISPHIIHGQTMSIVNAGLPTFLSHILFKIPYILHGQGSDVYYVPGNFIGKKLTKMIWKNAGSIIVLTEDMKKSVENVVSSPIHVIPNGIDPGKCSNIVNEGYNKSKKDGIKKIIFVGRLHEIKGVSYLIKSMVNIIKYFPNIKLLIVGDGPERKKLELLTNRLNLEKFVIFYGEKENTESIKLISTSDILVLPSLSEGFPRVILEGLLCGVPIVASDIRGISEIILDGKNGFLFNPRNVEDLSRKIINLLNDQKLCNEISKNNKEKIKMYNWDKIVKNVEFVYYDSIQFKN